MIPLFRRFCKSKFEKKAVISDKKKGLKGPENQGTVLFGIWMVRFLNLEAVHLSVKTVNSVLKKQMIIYG